MAAFSFAGLCANTMPRSRRNARSLAHRCTTRDRPVLNTMDRLQIQWSSDLIGAKRILPHDGLSDRLRGGDVIVIRLPEGLHKLSRGQP